MIARAVAETIARLTSGGKGRDRVDDRKADDVREGTVEQLLAVEAEQRPL